MSLIWFEIGSYTALFKSQRDLRATTPPPPHPSYLKKKLPNKVYRHQFFSTLFKGSVIIRDVTPPPKPSRKEL
jgi:hypothetical protein